MTVRIVFSVMCCIAALSQLLIFAHSEPTEQFLADLIVCKEEVTTSDAYMIRKKNDASDTEEYLYESGCWDVFANMEPRIYAMCTSVIDFECFDIRIGIEGREHYAALFPSDSSDVELIHK